jgi:hypothetical protein
MDATLKDWVIKKHEKLDPKSKESFLRTMKFAPDQTLEVISSCVLFWGMSAACDTNKVVSQCLETDPPEILEALQEHFAEDIAAIAQ